MGYLGRRIGKSQDSGDSNPGGADGAVGGGILDLFSHGYFERQGDLYNAPGAAPPPPPITATGGTIGEYVENNVAYRAHTFTESTPFNITDMGGYSSIDIDYLCVAGGGGQSSAPQGANREAGSGAGGLLSSHPDVPSTYRQAQVSLTGTANIAVIVGGGGGGHANGNPSSIAFPTPVSTDGGGYGAYNDGNTGNPGGSGGGNWYTSNTPGQATNYPGPTQQGHPGGTQGGSNNWTGGGGGGAGAAGANDGSSRAAGRDISITGSPFEYARGGAANTYPSTQRDESGAPATGEGASGVGYGGSGIVVIRYPIGNVAPAAKATGGAISFAGGKTIHTFLASAPFNAPAQITGAEMLIVAGGGGGGNYLGGGGGGGEVLHLTNYTISAADHTVQVGGGGGGGARNAVNGVKGTYSYFSTTAAPEGLYARHGGPGAGHGDGSASTSGTYATNGGISSNAPGTGNGGGGASAGASGGSGSTPMNRSAVVGTLYGNNEGGSGTQGGTHASGGGAGAAANGVPGPTSTTGSNGGAGQQITIGGTSHYWGGGGGGGGISNPNGGGDGGIGGGGGAGSQHNGGGSGGGSAINAGSPAPGHTPGGHGGTNSGGGGGGGSHGNFNGGNGASGIVIIAYPT